MDFINFSLKMVHEATDVIWLEVLFQTVGPENLILNLRVLVLILGQALETNTTCQSLKLTPVNLVLSSLALLSGITLLII